MNVKVPLTAHYNGVLEDNGNGHVMGRIGEYVSIDRDGVILGDGVYLCSQVVPVESLAEHGALLEELSEAIVRLRQIIHITNLNVD